MSFFDPNAMDHEDDDDLQSFCGSIEEPPFALVKAEAPHTAAANLEEPAPFSSQLVSNSGPQPVRSFFVNKLSDFISPSGSQETEKTTAMGSSILYSPMSQSNSQFIGSSSHNDDAEEFMDDAFEFDAAASLLAESPMLGRSSHFMERSAEPTPTRRDDSMAFSELMHEADNQQRQQSLSPSKSTLPSLPEDREMRSTSTSSSSVLTPRMTNRSLLGLFGSNDFSSSPRGGINRLFQNRGIESTRIDQDSFEMSMYIYSACSVQDIMDVIGNPDLLRLWCEPVRTLVVTRCSAGSRSAMSRREPRANREYDGEWVEATTSTLSTPQKHSSSLYQLGQYLWSHLGFPSYGKITMFVERRRGQVGLTMGPFAGDMTAFHTLSVIEGDGFVRIMDRVRVSRDDEDHSSFICCCGLCDAMQRCFMPSQLDGHIEQSMASMTRLRVMIENGESALMDDDSPPDLIVEGEEEDVSRLPLLS